ncbi:exosortase U [Rubritalea sp.]|uniref:exosortase U n=1 Tax=Rubritalea sp. TaxID=2109375 RepID=UPI003F4AB428
MKRFGVWLFALVYVVLLSPLLVEYSHSIFGRKIIYHFLPVLWLSLVGLFIFRWKAAAKVEKNAPYWVITLFLSGSFLSAVVGYLYYNAWPVAASVMLMLAALFCYLLSLRKIKGLWGIWVLMLFSLRLPDQIEYRILSLFEGISLKIGSQVLDRVGVAHLMQSDVMVINGYEIAAGRISNSYFSIIAVAALAGLFCVIKRRKALHLCLMVIVGLLVAAGVNVLRVVLVGGIYGYFDVDILKSWWLYALLAVSYGLAFAALLCADAFVAFLLAPVKVDSRKPDGLGLSKLWNWIVRINPASVLEKRRPGKSRIARKIAVVTSCLGLGVLALFSGLIMNEIWSSEGGEKHSMFGSKDELVMIDPTLVQFTRPGWEVLSVETEQRDFASVWGQFSFIWRLQYQDSLVIMALDYPFDSWHDVRVCYTQLGWKVDSIANAESGDFEEWKASETLMGLPTGDYGFILCSHSDQKGGVVQPKPADTGVDMLAYYLNPKQWQEPFKIESDKSLTTYYQTQTMVTTPFPLGEEMKQEIREMYGEFREQTRKLLEEEGGKHE